MKSLAIQKFNRRSFLKRGLLSSVALSAGLGGTVAAADASRRRESRKVAKNVIFLVSDGMSMGTLSMADKYLYWKEGRHSHWLNAYRNKEGVRGVMDMSSANSIVTDSAAAASSWGCGQRVNNGALNINPEGKAVEPILWLAKQAGIATGLVTSATVTHATPAGFAANVDDRNNEAAIALQYLEREYDVLLGGGKSFFSADERDDKKDLLGAFSKKGYVLAHTTGELQKIGSSEKKVLGLFEDRFLPFEINRINNEKQKKDSPSLAEISRKALEILARSDNGFIIQIEGARVDHAAHENDLGALIYDQLAFDEAVGAAFEFQQQHPETLVIVTSDHGNANPGMNSLGGLDNGEKAFSVLSRCRGTYEKLGLKKGLGAGEVKERFHEVMDLEITSSHAQMMVDYLEGNIQWPNRRMMWEYSFIGQIMSHYHDVGWVGNSHTSDLVELLAIGPGSEWIQPFNLNTDMFNVMKKALGI